MLYNFSFLFLGAVVIHYVPVHALIPSANSMHEYWRDMNEHNREVAVQSSHNMNRFYEIGKESTGRSLEVLNENNEIGYENHNTNNERNSKKYEDIHEDSGKRSKTGNYGGKRGRLAKSINEWLLFLLILHCLFAGALLGQHWNPLEPPI